MKFSIVMSCYSCKWRIDEELRDKGFSNFKIDVNNRLIIFEDDVNPEHITSLMKKIGYHCEYIPENPLLDRVDQLSDEELEKLLETMERGESLEDLDFLNIKK